jgi:hypothetical protein
MQILLESPVFDETVQVPDGTDARTAGSLLPAFETLADRTRFFKAQLDTGIKRVREFASLGALKALTGMGDGEVALVVGLGLYRYEAAAADASAEPLVLVPNGAGGRWRHHMASIAGLAGGFASLDSPSGRVKAAQLSGNLLGAYEAVPTGVPSTLTGYTISGTSSGTAVTMITATTSPGTVSLTAGDNVLLSVKFSARRNASGGADGVVFQLVVTTSTDVRIVDEFDIELVTTESWPVTMTGVLASATANQTITNVALRAYASSTGSVQIYRPSAFKVRLLHYRG